MCRVLNISCGGGTDRSRECSVRTIYTECESRDAIRGVRADIHSSIADIRPNSRLSLVYSFCNVCYAFSVEIAYVWCGADRCAVRIV